MTSTHQLGTEDSPTLLFLVELRAAIGVPTDLNGMRGALTTSIERLRAGGVHIDHADAFLLPGDARCLYLVQASDPACVALACDAAGLTAAPVHEAHRVPAEGPAGDGPAANHLTLPAVEARHTPETS